MKIKFSSHALKRLKERGISRSVVSAAIQTPDKVGVSQTNKNRLLFKKIYYHQVLGRDHLFMLVCEKREDVLEIVTVIDTSKISKYF